MRSIWQPSPSTVYVLRLLQGFVFPTAPCFGRYITSLPTQPVSQSTGFPQCPTHQEVTGHARASYWNVMIIYPHKGTARTPAENKSGIEAGSSNATAMMVESLGIHWETPLGLTSRNGCGIDRGKKPADLTLLFVRGSRQDEDGLIVGQPPFQNGLENVLDHVIMLGRHRLRMKTL